MAISARDDILNRLKSAVREEAPPRPSSPVSVAATSTLDEMFEAFSRELSKLTGSVYRVKDRAELWDRLTAVAREEGLGKVMISTDSVLAKLDIPMWGERSGVAVLRAGESDDREDFKRSVFEEVQAGITGVDYAIAESGTICLAHSSAQARLISVAPPLHIAIIPCDRLRLVYEGAIEEIYKSKKVFPSQMTFITGPSLTGDIQATLTYGMHGPRKVVAIFIG